MSAEPLPFHDLVRRIRAGDEAAAVELVREYEPLVRREVRLRLLDQRLARAFDSLDICQSVWASFFVRTAAGQYDLERPDQLVGLLVTMARNKLASASRDENRDRRDQRRVETCSHGAWLTIPAREAVPGQTIEARELLQSVMQQLTPEERRLAEHRGNALSWNEIAQQMGGSAQGRRMQFSRAIDRAVKILGIDHASP